MNLLQDAWIPVITAVGARRIIAPWQVTEHHADKDAIVSLGAPRPDFDGALIQFLIGLVQTASAPPDPPGWRTWRDRPPAPEALRAAFAPYAGAFELGGEGPRFMQDLTLSAADKPTSQEVGALLIESPGENALKNNADVFVKRGGVTGLCWPCAAMALFTLQINAPSGGVGHRTSLRGGGPLTTLVLARTVWDTIWLNTLDRQSLAIERAFAPEQVFPWLLATRTSEKDRAVTPEDVHKLQQYWAMPRRIRLTLDDASSGRCSLCGVEAKLVREYVTKNYGASYRGGWEHPLTPHSQLDNGPPAPRHGQAGAISYRHWLGLVQERKVGNAMRRPARVVDAFFNDRVRKIQRKADGGKQALEFRLWGFGYDMDNMKARGWYEGTMPLMRVSPEHRDAVADIVLQLVDASRHIADALRQCVRNGLFGKPTPGPKGRPVLKTPQAIKTDTTLFETLDSHFWQATEAKFYKTLGDIVESIETQKDHEPCRAEWHRTLCRSAEELFSMYVEAGDLTQGNPQRIALARRDLAIWTHGKKIRDALGLASHDGKHSQGPSAA